MLLEYWTMLHMLHFNMLLALNNMNIFFIIVEQPIVYECGFLCSFLLIAMVWIWNVLHRLVEDWSQGSHVQRWGLGEVIRSRGPWPHWWINPRGIHTLMSLLGGHGSFRKWGLVGEVGLWGCTWKGISCLQPLPWPSSWLPWVEKLSSSTLSPHDALPHHKHTNNGASWPWF